MASLRKTFILNFTATIQKADLFSCSKSAIQTNSNSFSDKRLFSSTPIVKQELSDNSDKVFSRSIQFNNLDDICSENSNKLLKYLVKMSQMNKKNLRISIEGNISSGKSSIINYLKKKVDHRDDILSDKILFDETNCDILTCKLNERNLNTSNKGTLDFLKQSNVNLKIIPEPVHLWRNLNGNNLLDLMYQDPEKWAFPFHSYVQLTMLQNHLELLNNGDSNVASENFKGEELHINIMERSLFSARYCFAQNLANSNMINKAQYEILDKWYNWMSSSHDCNLDIIFYLRTNPEVCMSRLQKRGRPEETTSVSMEYLQKIHDLHERWLNPSRESLVDTSSYYRPPSVIIIDGDQSLDDVYKIIEKETKDAVTMVN